jgi:TolA-binding protein
MKEAENTVIDGRLRDIADEILRHQANVKALQKGVETLRAEVAEYEVEFLGSYDKDLQEAMAEKGKALGGDPAKMSEAERKKYDELMAVETKRFRDAYAANRLQSLRAGIEAWSAQETQAAQEAARQKQVLSAREDECRRLGGDLAEAAKHYASLKISVEQREKRFGDADAQAVKKKQAKDEAERLYQEALASRPAEISVRRDARDAANQAFERAETFLRQQVSDKDRARLAADQAELRALQKKAEAGDKLMAPGREHLALEKAKFDLLAAKQQAAAAAVAFCRLAAANPKFDAPEVRAAAAVPVKAWNEAVRLAGSLAVLLVQQEELAQEGLQAEQLAKQKKLVSNRKSLAPSIQREKASKAEAIKWLRDYVARNVGDAQMMPMVLAKTAFILVDQGDFPGAEAMLKRLSTEFPQSSVARQAQFTLGRAQCEGGQFAAAAVSFEKALRETGREIDLSSLNYIVNRMTDNGQPAVAMQAARLLRDRTPADRKETIANWSYLRQNALLRYGQAAVEAKEYDAAVTVLEELLTGFKDGWARIEALRLLSLANRSKTPPDLVAAASALERALANRGLDAEERLRLQCLLGETCALRPDRTGLEEAAAAYELVLIAWTPAAAEAEAGARRKLDDWYEKAWLEFARLKARLGDRKRADAAVADYRTNFPKGRYLNEIGNLPAPDAPAVPVPAAGDKKGGTGK